MRLAVGLDGRRIGALDSLKILVTNDCHRARISHSPDNQQGGFHVPWADKDAWWEKVRNGTLDTYSMEKRYVRKDGSYIWVNRTVSCVRDASGKLRHFISVVEDISARKSTEAALRESQERLQLAQQVENVGTFDSESRLRAAFSQSCSLLVLLQPDGTIIEANRAALNAAGGDASKVVGHKWLKRGTRMFCLSEFCNIARLIRTHLEVVAVWMLFAAMSNGERVHKMVPP